MFWITAPIWGVIASPACPCGESRQTTRHIVEECPLTAFPECLRRLHEAGLDAVEWLSILSMQLWECSKRTTQVNVNGQRETWKEKIKYLGIIQTNDMDDDVDICAKKGECIDPVNRLNAQFFVVPDQIRIRLLQTNCTAWYGCYMWLHNRTPVNGMTIEWQKAVQYMARRTRYNVLGTLDTNRVILRHKFGVPRKLCI